MFIYYTIESDLIVENTTEKLGNRHISTKKMEETERVRDKEIRKERERREENLDLENKVCGQIFWEYFFSLLCLAIALPFVCS